MKKLPVILFFIFVLTIFSFNRALAQCSICTRTAQQLGEKPAKGLNSGIIYLALAPFMIGGYVYYRWRRNNRDDEDNAEVQP